MRYFVLVALLVLPVLIINVYGEESFSDNAIEYSFRSGNPVISTTCEDTAMAIGSTIMVKLESNTESGYCNGAIFKYNVFPIPDGSTITGASIAFNIGTTNNDVIPQRTCDWKWFDFDANGNMPSYDALMLDINGTLGNVTDILENTTSCQNSTGNGYGDVFDIDNIKELFESDINGDDTIVLGLTFENMTRGTDLTWVKFEEDATILTITYIPPLQYQIDELESRIIILENTTAQNTTDISSIQSIIDSLILHFQNFLNDVTS